MVGTTTLRPGDSTILELPLLMGMHRGMGGPHLMAVDIWSNDSIQPVKTLRWRFMVADEE